MKFAHIIIAMTGRGDHADMIFQRQGENAAVLVGFQTAGGNQTLAFENRSGYPESVLPMGLLGVNLDPILLRQIVKIDDVDIKFFHERDDTFFRHDVTGKWITAFTKTYRFGAHFPDFFNQDHQRIIMGRARRRIRGVEVGLDQHILVLNRIDIQSPNG